MNKVAVLCSGGMDSAVLLDLYHNLNYEIYVLYVDYNNKNSIQEIEKLNKLLERYKIDKDHFHKAYLGLPWSKSSCIIGNSSDASPYVEMRNVIFISLALSLCCTYDIPEIALGFISLKEDYVDTCNQFMEAINNLTGSMENIKVSAPLHNLDKRDVFKLGCKLDPLLNIEDTFSCNTPVNGKPCGRCADCMDIAYVKGESQWEDSNTKDLV